MKDYVFKLFLDAKKTNDLKKMKYLYETNKNNLSIKLEYAKSLIDNRKISEAELLLNELLETNNYLYAMLELGKLEENRNNVLKAKEYFFNVLKYGGFKDKNFALLELGKLERKLGNFSEAQQYFNRVIDKGSDEDKICGLLELGKLHYNNNQYYAARKCFGKLLKSDNQVSRTYGIRVLLLLNIRAKKLKKACENINYALKNNIDVNYSNILYVSKKLNIFFDYDYNEMLGYQQQQAIEYDEYYAIDHIVHRHCGDSIEGKKVCFNDDIDVYKLFNDIKAYLTSSYKINELLYNDMYIIPYSNIGADGQNYLKIVTLPNSRKILTMYPVYDGSLSEESDINVRRR